MNIYQHTYNIAKPFIDNFRVALDVGARKGESWENMCPDFDQIHSFEPRREYHSIFKQMLASRPEYADRSKLHGIALGETVGEVNMFGAVIVDKENCPSYALNDRTRIIKQKQLDNFNFENVDYIKIDVEGHELNVLKGGIETLQRCRPVVVIEQNHITEDYNKGKKFDALHYLRSLGYEVVAFDSCTDYVLKYKS